MPQNWHFAIQSQYSIKKILNFAVAIATENDINAIAKIVKNQTNSYITSLIFKNH